MNRLEHCTPAMLRRLADVVETHPRVMTHPDATVPRTVAVEMDDVVMNALVSEQPPEGEGRVVIRAIS